MIRAWLDLPSAGIFATLIALYFGMAALLTIVTFCRPLARKTQSLSGVVAPFFGSVAILFALLSGFLASDVGERNRQAYRAVQAETGELHNVYTLSIASASDMRSIRAALKAYVNSAISEEWPAMADGRTSPRTDLLYDDLLKEVSAPSIAGESGNAVHAALLNATIRLGTARNDRLALAADHTNDLKWIMVILLGLFTQVAIALVHMERPRAFMASLALFSGAVVVTLGIIALQEYPFYGAFQISPAPLQTLPISSE
ncbi:DUF4239 domain-containing protein [Afipia sp. TerB]